MRWTRGFAARTARRTGRRCRGRGGRDRLGLGFGWHLDGTGTQAFEVRFEGSRVDRVNDGAEHGVGLTLTARW